MDGRGTPYRGREWERAIWGNLIRVTLEDQCEGVQVREGGDMRGAAVRGGRRCV